jgi:GTPase SAR1 family protein
MASKYVLFVVGEDKSGKSSLIRSLTGCGRNKVYNVKNTSGKPLRAFVSLNAPQEMGMKRHSPQNFPKSIEDKYGIDRNDYDILISALRLTVNDQAAYGYRQYIQSVRSQGFEVRLAVIETSWDNVQADPNELATIKTYARSNGITLISMNASNDPNEEASKMRQGLYP